jgi:hypothetical protein
MSKKMKRITVLAISILVGILISTFSLDYEGCNPSLQHTVVVQRYFIMTFLVLSAIDIISDIRKTTEN